MQDAPRHSGRGTRRAPRLPKAVEPAPVAVEHPRDDAARLALLLVGGRALRLERRAEFVRHVERAPVAVLRRASAQYENNARIIADIDAELAKAEA